MSGPNANPTPTVQNIQALRGIAALFVVWQHASVPLRVVCPDATPIIPLMPFGPIGVDLFFIISGYVISMTACRKNNGPRDFLFARIARVVPLYFVITLYWIAFGYVGHGSPYSFLSVWNGLFYLPIFDMGGLTEPPLDVGWTLSFEMTFYLAFALLLVAAKPRRVALIMPVFFATGAVGFFAYHGAWYFPRFVFHPFVLEFCFGCLVFMTQDWGGGKLSWIYLVAAVVYFLVFSIHSAYLGDPRPLFHDRIDLAWMRVILWGVPVALLVAGLVGLERQSGFVLPKVLVWVGGFSYSLYLVHRTAGNLVAGMGRHLGIHNPYLILIAMITLSLVLGWLCYTTLEKPLIAWAQERLKVKTGAPRESNPRGGSYFRFAR